VYLLAEQQQISKDRVDITEAAEGYTGTDIGYLLEFDGYFWTEDPLQQFIIDYADNAALIPFDGNDGSGRTMKCLSDPEYGGKSDIGFSIKNDIYSQEQRDFIASFMAEVVQGEGFHMDLVHLGAGIANRADLVGIKFDPPKCRCGHREHNRDHPAILGMNCAALCQTGHQLVVIFADDVRVDNSFFDALFFTVLVCLTLVTVNLFRTMVAVHLVPAVLGVPHTFNDDLPLFRGWKYRFFNFQHNEFPFV
jgi:hypothetical protein